MGGPLPGSPAAARAQALTHELTAMRPRPAVVVAIDDGKETPIRLVPGRGRWIQCGRQMVELLDEGKRIEARDAKGQYLAGWNPDSEPTSAEPGATAGLVPTEADAQLAFLARLESEAFQRFTAAAAPLLAEYRGIISEQRLFVAEITKRAAALETMNMDIVKALVQAQVDRGAVEVELMRARVEAESDGTDEARDARQMKFLELFIDRFKERARGRRRNGADDDAGDDSGDSEGH